MEKIYIYIFIYEYVADRRNSVSMSANIYNDIDTEFLVCEIEVR